MKKRILSCLMALALCLTLLPATALAEDGHTHCLCGAAHNSDIKTHQEGQKTTFATRLSYGSGKSIWFSDGEPLKVENNQWLLPEGCYYLDDHTSDTYVTKYTIKITGNVTICLNGQKIEKIGGDKAPVFEVTNGYVLTLTDCKGSGKVTHSSMEKEGSGVYVSGGTFEMHNNASVTENKAFGNDATLNGAGVYVTGRNTTFTMHNSARVTRNTASGTGGGDNDNGGGVYVSVSGQNGKFEMNDSASVTGNTATGYGGGVYVKSGTFTARQRVSATTRQPNTAVCLSAIGPPSPCPVSRPSRGTQRSVLTALSAMCIWLGTPTSPLPITVCMATRTASA